MSLKKHIAIALTAIGLLAGGAVASAQTTTTTNTGTTGVTASTTGTTGTTGTPGTPNTGAGGDAAANWAILAVTGIVVIGGVAYLMRKPELQSDVR